MKLKISNLQLVLFVFVLIGIGSSKNLIAQTWVTTDFWDGFHGIYVNRDSVGVGPYQMCRTTNGNIYMLVQENVNQLVRLISFDSNGQIIYDTQASQSGGTNTERTGSLRACQNNSVVYNTIHIGSSDYSITVKTGPHPWTKTSFSPQVVKEIIPTCYNTFILDYFDVTGMGHDSIAETDSSGNFIRFKFLTCNRIDCVQDSDLIVFENDKVTKQDFNGTIKWTFNDSLLTPISSDTANIYCYRMDSISKIRTKDGSLVWRKYIPHTLNNHNYSFNNSALSNVSITQDSGLIVTNDYEISRYDSSGNLLWTKTDNFPVFGFGGIIEDTAGYFLTGGAFRCLDASYTLIQFGYSYFVTRLDSNGNGTLDSTDHYFNGNANDNGVASFGDDAAYIGAALGNTGPQTPAVMQQASGPISTFGADWSGGFSNGLNYKFSDADGNGILDTNDLHLVAYAFGYGHTVYPHWRHASSSTINDLIVDIAEDTLMPGDSVTIYIRLDPSATVDSIYSISVDLMFPYLQAPAGASAVSQSNNFGTPGVNMYSYFANCAAGSNIRYLMSKTDHLNSILHGDTLMKFRFALSGGINGILNTHLSCHAITEGGFDVAFNPVNDSIYFFDPTTVVNELSYQSILIAPNPGNGFFTLTTTIDIDELIVMNSEGKIVLKRNDHLSNIDLSTQPDGIYFVQLRADNHLLRKRLTLIH